MKTKAVGLSSWPLWIMSDSTCSSSGSYQLKVTAQNLQVQCCTSSFPDSTSCLLFRLTRAWQWEHKLPPSTCRLQKIQQWWWFYCLSPAGRRCHSFRRATKPRRWNSPRLNKISHLCIRLHTTDSNPEIRFEKRASTMMHMLTFRVTMEGPKDHKVKARGSNTQSFKREIESVCGKLLPPKGQRGTYTCLLPAKCIRRWSRLILPCQVGRVFPLKQSGQTCILTGVPFWISTCSPAVAGGYIGSHCRTTTGAWNWNYWWIHSDIKRSGNSLRCGCLSECVCVCVWTPATMRPVEGFLYKFY